MYCALRSPSISPSGEGDAGLFVSHRRPKMNMELLRKYNSLTLQKRDLQAQLRDIDEQLKPLEDRVLNELIEEGVQRLNVDGVTTYIRHDIYPSYPQGKEEAVKLLKRSRNYRSLVQETVNHQTLCSALRELDGNLPRNWQGILETTDVYRVGVKTTS
jgi:hypothetical protein